MLWASRNGSCSKDLPEMCWKEALAVQRQWIRSYSPLQQIPPCVWNQLKFSLPWPICAWHSPYRWHTTNTFPTMGRVVPNICIKLEACACFLFPEKKKERKKEEKRWRSNLSDESPQGWYWLVFLENTDCTLIFCSLQVLVNIFNNLWLSCNHHASG